MIKYYKKFSCDNNNNSFPPLPGISPPADMVPRVYLLTPKGRTSRGRYRPQLNILLMIL